MTIVLQIHDRTVSAEEIIPLLARYQLLPQLLREIFIEEAIAPFTCTPEEVMTACKKFYTQNKLTTETDLEAWLQKNRITREQLSDLATREVRIEKFKQATWGHKLESYFLSRKRQLDRAIYSLLRTKDAGIAQEIYFRIQAGEQSFAEAARQYSQGPEAQTGGLVGPVELNSPHPKLAQILAASKPGQLWPPMPVEEWLAIVRLEKFIPAQLDEQMRHKLLNELFATWLQEQLNSIDYTSAKDTPALTTAQ